MTVDPMILMYPELKKVYDESDEFGKRIFSDTVYHFIYKKGLPLMETLSKYFGFLSDNEIKSVTNLITPFVDKKVKDCTMSYGLEPYGYTLRLSKDCPTVIKPKEALLVSTMETISMPNNFEAWLWGKSSYTRQFIFFSFGSTECIYRGTISFAIFNAGNQDVKLYPEEGICQIHFFRCTDVASTQYDGKYQDSKGTTKFM